MNKAIFLDRDGIILKNPGFINNPEQVELFHDIITFIKKAREMDYLVIVVTNQGGVGLGYITEDQLNNTHAEMLNQLEEGGAKIDAVYYCPYHPDAPDNYPDHAGWRKPNPGMLEGAAQAFVLDLSQCVMVGDMPSDVQAGYNAGCDLNVLVDRSLVETPYPHIEGYVVVADLADVATLIQMEDY